MIEAVLIGAGERGMVSYASYALKKPHELKFVAVAEPNEERRQRFAKLHGIAPERQFASWEALLEQPRLSRAALICTQDADHYRPTMLAIERGYDILLEKPMSPDPAESLMMAAAAEQAGCVLTVCHTMRYSPYYYRVKQLVDSGVVGRIVNIHWMENVGYWHQAHSFVRGNWRNSRESSPMILAKTCHDLDMLQWLVGTECEQVSSFGSLTHFREDQAPAGSTARCTDGCAVESTCAYSAIKWYYNTSDHWPQSVVSADNSLEARWEAISRGPYGRCVYRCDNDVVDHQVATMRFAGDVTVAFTMTAFSVENTRSFTIMGTEGELRGRDKSNEIEIYRFDGTRQTHRPAEVDGGHAGADTMIMQDFVQQLERGDKVGRSSGRVSAQNHLIAFAAERSRLTGETVDLRRFEASLLEAGAL
ncbi:Gfo/Idh/MocA family protein [Paenibacillus koleovorans]|uniref:Gfo/Idh/MocA family protein n=1 Tax=Paenibacillus koleovorans TaxID=121608 RepID=UPI000FDC6E36|nr:Gfo/Idh/MocA family oxidoreductase [Paenibacillus koleovorans]